MLEAWLRLKTRNPGKARRILRFGAMFFILLLISIGAANLWQDYLFRSHAQPAVAEIAAHIRDPSTAAFRLAPQLLFRDVTGQSQRIVLTGLDVQAFPLGAHIDIQYDASNPARARLAGDKQRLHMGLTFLLTGLLGACCLWFFTGRTVHAAKATRPMSTDAPVTVSDADDQPFFAGPLPAGEPLDLYSLAGWPLMRLRTPAGGLSVMGMDRESGAFVPRYDLSLRLHEGAIDLDPLDMTAFRALIRDWRERLMQRHCTQSTTWIETGQGEFPLRGEIAGLEALIRINDYPAEPLYSVIVAGQNIGNLENWPAAWQQAQPPASTA